MYAKVCPVCRNKFYTENNYYITGSDLHNYCKVNKKFKSKRRERPTRTSTPVAELESSQNLNSSDSVSDFFYQSWKRGLHSEDSETSRMLPNQWNYQPYAVLQPVCYSPQVVYASTVFFQAFIPAPCMQQLGYRPDGTFGILPGYWTYTV